MAQVAACLGREFAYPLLAAVSPVPELELRAALERLTAAELVFARGEPPEAAYTFKHALVRDAAHESLLKTRRRELHGRIVKVLEQGFAEIAEAEPEPLARHCGEAGLTGAAIGYWHKAGLQAVARSAMAEAIVQLNRGLDLLGGLPDGPARQRLELDLQTTLGGALIAAKGWAAEETGEAVARARELCRTVGETPLLFPVMVGQWSIHFNRGEIEQSVAVGEDLLRLAQEQQDLGARVMAHRNLGCALLCLGRLASARRHLEQILALYDPVPHGSLALRYMHLDPWVTGLNWLSFTLFTLGYPDQALTRCPEALAYARTLTHGITMGISLFQAAGMCQLCRDRDGVLERADELIALATEQGQTQHLALGSIFRGWALVVGGDREAGTDQLQWGLAAYRATGGRSWLSYFLALLAEAQGLAPDALETLDQALAHAERSGERWFLAELHRRKGAVLVARGLQPDGEGCLRQALAVAREQGARMWELRAARDLARLWWSQGRPQEARALLQPVEDQAVPAQQMAHPERLQPPVAQPVPQPPPGPLGLRPRQEVQPAGGQPPHGGQRMAVGGLARAQHGRDHGEQRRRQAVGAGGEARRVGAGHGRERAGRRQSGAGLGAEHQDGAGGVRAVHGAAATGSAAARAGPG